MRLRSWSAKWGVEAPISWRTSSRVGSRRRRSARSNSLMGRDYPVPASCRHPDGNGRPPGARNGSASPILLWGPRLGRHPVGRRVDAPLLVDRDRLVVAEDPGAVVDGLGRVVLVARLDAQQVA